MIRHRFAVLACTLFLCAASAAHGQQPPGQTPASEPEPVDPVVQLVLESNPQSPEELLQAIDALRRLDAAEAAKPFLDRLVAANLGPDRLATLARNVGSNVLLKLANTEGLQPAGAEFAEAALKASSDRARDPQRLAAAIRRLSDPAPEVRRAAMVDLEEGHHAAVAALLAALADGGRADEHSRIANALARLEPLSIGPLFGALESRDPAFQARVMRLLAALDVQRAANYMIAAAVSDENRPLQQAAQSSLGLLMGAAPDQSVAERVLRRKIDQYLRNVRPFTPDHEGQVTLWHWDDATRKATEAKYPADDVGIMLAARLAEDLYRLDPDNTEYRDLYLATNLQAAKIRGGFDKPIQATAGGAGGIYRAAAGGGTAALENALRFALQHELWGAATAAVEILGEIGTPELLISHDGRPRLLAEAVRSRDRRLRFAALQAVMKLNPQRPFAGDSFVPQALGFFAATSGSKRAVVGHPRISKGQTLIARLGPLGYDGEAAGNGRRLIEVARESADVDLILIDMSIDGPAIREVLYQLRKCTRTGRVPVGIVATLGTLDEAERLAYNDPLTEAFPRPHSNEAVKTEVERLQALAPRAIVSDQERAQQSLQALRWLGTLAADKNSIYDLQHQGSAVEKALRVPQLSAVAAPVLAQLGTASAQRELVNLASTGTVALADRQAAAKAFALAVEQFGILLTTEEIGHQYDRYNASEGADAETQKVLGYLLDVIEAPSQEKQ